MASRRLAISEKRIYKPRLMAHILAMDEFVFGMRARYVARFIRRGLGCLLLGVLISPLSHLMADDFPLAKGNYWIYRGETKYLVKDPVSNKNVPKTEVLTWKMEVIDTATRGPFFAALIKGFPFDLSWYEPGKIRGDYLILGEGNAVYRVFSGQDAREVWAKIKETGRPPADFKESGEVLLDLPLKEGKTFGEVPGNQAKGRYCWVVEGERAFNPKRFPAAGKLDNARDFTLIYRTNPDHQILDFVPGIGIVGYQYIHHGTPSETNLGLIQFGTAK